MSASDFDPYAAQARWIWANRCADWRARRAELALHAVLGAAIAGLLLALVAMQREAIASLVAWVLRGHALSVAVIVLVLLALDQRASRQRHFERIQRDWLAAQPLEAALRRRRLRRMVLGRAAGQALALLLTAWFARVPVSVAAWLAAVVPAAAMIARWMPDRAPARARPASRETPFAARGRASFWRWQWIEAGASLAPRRLAWALLALLLVPRGAFLMAGVGVGLVALTAASQAWQRGLAVIPAAQRWIAPQPVRPQRWLLACVAMPLALLSAVLLVLGWIALAAGSSTLAVLTALGLGAFGTLQLAVQISERRTPQRAPWVFLLHAVLMAAIAQALPPLAPALWLLQLAWLTRRSLRA